MRVADSSGSANPSWMRCRTWRTTLVACGGGTRRTTSYSARIASKLDCRRPATDWSVSYGAGQRVGAIHALTNVTATVVQAVSWVARRRGRRATGIALSGAALGLTVVAGYLGGHLTLVQGVGVNHTAFEPEVTDWTTWTHCPT